MDKILHHLGWLKPINNGIIINSIFNLWPNHPPGKWTSSCDLWFRCGSSLKNCSFEALNCLVFGHFSTFRKTGFLDPQKLWERITSLVENYSLHWSWNVVYNDDFGSGTSERSDDACWGCVCSLRPCINKSSMRLLVNPKAYYDDLFEASS